MDVHLEMHCRVSALLWGGAKCGCLLKVKRAGVDPCAEPLKSRQVIMFYLVRTR